MRRRDLWHRPTLTQTRLPDRAFAVQVFRYPRIPAGLGVYVGRRGWVWRWLIPAVPMRP